MAEAARFQADAVRTRAHTRPEKGGAVSVRHRRGSAMFSLRRRAARVVVPMIRDRQNDRRMGLPVVDLSMFPKGPTALLVSV